MPIDSNIALSVATPQATNPIDNYSKAVALKDMMTQDRLRQQQIIQSQIQTQNLQAEAQQRERGLADENNYTQAIKDAKGNFGEALDRLGREGTVSGSYLMAKRNAVDKLITDKLTRTSAERAEDKAADDDIYNRILSVTALDPSQQPTQYANVMDAMKKDPRLAPRLDKGLKMGILQSTWPQESKPYMDTLGMVKNGQAYVDDQATKKSAQLETAAKTKRDDAETANLIANKPKIVAEAEEATTRLSLMKSTSMADWDAQVDAVSPPGMKDRTELNTRTKSLVHSALKMGDFKAAQAAIKDASDQIGRTETAVATARNTVPIKIDLGAALQAAKADASGLTDDDYKRSGEQYARTGAMPAMGRDSLTRGKIAHQANEWARDNGFSPQQIVMMQAAYAGDKKSLTTFQAQRDQIVSFENTAKKNLDLFLNASSKIADSGAPWINKPLRELDLKGLGSAEVAAVNAARQVANNEIAKVTSGGGLSGVVSDSNRKEVDAYNPATATYAQTVAVANILKQDMANRHQSMDATLADIKNRIGGGQGDNAGPNNSVTITPPKETTMDAVRAYAAKHKITEAQARKHAEDDGYKVK